jgi:hypothetical protein
VKEGCTVIGSQLRFLAVSAAYSALILSKKLKIAVANSEQSKLGIVEGNRYEAIRF